MKKLDITILIIGILAIIAIYFPWQIRLYDNVANSLYSILLIVIWTSVAIYFCIRQWKKKKWVLNIGLILVGLFGIITIAISSLFIGLPREYLELIFIKSGSEREKIIFIHDRGFMPTQTDSYIKYIIDFPELGFRLQRDVGTVGRDEGWKMHEPDSFKYERWRYIIE